MEETASYQPFRGESKPNIIVALVCKIGGKWMTPSFITIGGNRLKGSVGWFSIWKSYLTLC
jgi:hypothetical protein